MTVIFIVFMVTICELIIGRGSICRADYARVRLQTRSGSRLHLGEAFKNSGSGIPWIRIIIALALICYLFSVLVENKHNFEDLLLHKVRPFAYRVFKGPSQVSQDPEHGEESQASSGTTEARGPVIGTHGSTNPSVSTVSHQISNPTAPTAWELPSIIQVADYRPSSSHVLSHYGQEVESVQDGRGSHSENPPLTLEMMSCPQLASTEVQEATSVLLSPSDLEGRARDQANMDTAQLQGSGEHLGESPQDMSWKVSFLLGILAFILCLLFTLADMTDGLAAGLFARIGTFSFHCLPFYWVILVDDCFLVTKRIVRTWLADNLHIYCD